MKTRRQHELGLSGKVITRTKFDTFDDVRTWVLQLPKRNEIGDGRQVGNIMTAIWEAYEVARGL